MTGDWRLLASVLGGSPPDLLPNMRPPPMSRVFQLAATSAPRFGQLSILTTVITWQPLTVPCELSSPLGPASTPSLTPHPRSPCQVRLRPSTCPISFVTPPSPIPPSSFRGVPGPQCWCLADGHSHPLATVSSGFACSAASACSFLLWWWRQGTPSQRCPQHRLLSCCRVHLGCPSAGKT